MQKETFLKYLENQDGAYFSFSVNGKVLAKNTKSKEKDEAAKILSDAWDLNVNDGDKLELTVSNATNFQGGVTLAKYNTISGKFEKTTMQAPAGLGGGSDLLTWFKMGYDQGYNAGKNDAEIQALRLERENETGRGRGLDMATLAENLSGTEQGQMILMSLMKKFGMLD